VITEDTVRKTRISVFRHFGIREIEELELSTSGFAKSRNPKILFRQRVAVIWWGFQGRTCGSNVEVLLTGGNDRPSIKRVEPVRGCLITQAIWNGPP
jgi:hypothetical protein